MYYRTVVNGRLSEASFSAILNSICDMVFLTLIFCLRTVYFEIGHYNAIENESGHVKLRSLFHNT